ncbi:P-loop containing nucleoside triphosphate hydrolase protein, partial [Blyttiomyces helicus]
ALQIFDVLRKVGKLHTFSAGLLIGGKDLKQEQERVARMNILVCTPGRLLQHMDQTPDFGCDNLQILVLDEADRILDCGFEKTINAIVANLPKERQTLLFSATQTKSVRDLARLSLKDPEYVAVHDKSEHSTPKQLVQKYLVCDLPQKLDILYSFIRSHLKQKVIVFVSSCKQVRFIHEVLCKLQPGTVIMCLHGKQKQPKRMAIFDQFCRKTAVVLIATDVAARGLDFPSVEWVVQLDCPEDADTYIHRVGRTARYESAGQALLMLLPSEEKGMMEELAKKKVPVERIRVNPGKTVSIQGKMRAFCSENPEIKYLAQKAFISYIRSVHLQGNKTVFDVHALPAEAYAESLGLPGAPKIKVIKKKNESRQLAKINAEEEKSEAVDSGDDLSEARSKIDKMFEKKNLTVLSEHYAKIKTDDDAADDDEEDFMTLKRKDHEVDDIELPILELSHRQLLRAKAKELKARGSGQKMVFDEEGNPRLAYELQSLDAFEAEGKVDERTAAYLEEASELMRVADAEDKTIAKEKMKAKKKERKMKERKLRQEEEDAPLDIDMGESDDDEEEEEEKPAVEVGRKRGRGAPPARQREEKGGSKKRRIDVGGLGQESLEDIAFKLLGGN